MLDKSNKAGRIEQALNRLLMPIAASYGYIKKIARKTHEKMPFLYEEIESLIRSQLIRIEKDRKLLHEPDIEKLSEVIASNVIRKLPSMDEGRLNSIIAEKSSLSFLDMLTRGLGAVEKEKDYTVLSKEKIFKKILIANRGEIALRVIRACKELGIKIVVIYSKEDKDSLAVKFADKAYCIGHSSAYLDIKKIIKTAKKAKVDAIHPGYGFLAENADFTRLCEENKIVFIGPSAKTMSIMGDKAMTREAMNKAGIPVIAGTNKLLRNEEHALDVAEKIGYPVIIKASAGGGGKGMRIVYDRKDVVNSYMSAQTEAEAAFGKKRLYMEKYIEDPRHIEFQALADKYGNIIHLGERECSIQRRHQKLIEEAPSPALDANLRQRMGEIAVKAVKAVGCKGAATVEFLLDKNKNFYFMEMNKRIQVEHGITEMITGVDLVKEQIKIAAGAKLAYTQDDIKINGWAIECRINAEDPVNDFEPSPGTITNYIPPGGPGIRICSSCHSGHIISHHYDPLIAKLMCSGKTRHEAIARMRGALSEYIIEGVETTIPFHKAVLNNRQFWKGNISTSFIDKNKIAEELKKHKKTKKKEIPGAKKALIVTTAVAKYLENKKSIVSPKPGQWVMAGRQEQMEQENF